MKGRTYKCFTEYMDLHPNSSIVEMDTVYNDGTNGPFIQTFQFVDYNLMIGIYHFEKTSAAMVDGLKQIKEILGEKEFHRHFQVILTDRGSEASEMEFSEASVFLGDSLCGPAAFTKAPVTPFATVKLHLCGSIFK